MKNTFLAISTLLIALACAGPTSAQRSKAPRVCGDPEGACKGRSSFQSWELPVEWPANSFIAESKPFYAIILKSAKSDFKFENCEKTFPATEINNFQAQWPNNKVFALQCAEPGYVYYTGVPGDVVFVAVFAGNTLAEANRFLKTVKSSGEYSGLKVRKLRAGVNGT